MKSPDFDGPCVLFTIVIDKRDSAAYVPILQHLLN